MHWVCSDASKNYPRMNPAAEADGLVYAVPAVMSSAVGRAVAGPGVASGGSGRSVPAVPGAEHH